MLSLYDTLVQLPYGKAVPSNCFLTRREHDKIVHFLWDRGDYKKRIAEDALIITPKDMFVALQTGYSPELVVCPFRSWLLDASRTLQVEDEKEVIAEVVDKFAIVNTSLMFDTFSQEVSTLLAQFRGLQNVWEEYEGILYVALNASPMELFMIDFYGNFFIPSILIANDNMDEELALSESVDTDPEGAKHANTMLVIDYKGPVFRLSDGSFLIPHYQAFSLESFDLNKNVVEVHLQGQEVLKGEAREFGEDYFDWINVRTSTSLTKKMGGKMAYRNLNVLRESFQRKFKLN